MDRVVIPTYKDEQGKEIPAHTVEVPTADEIKQQVELNVKNTAEAIRRRAVSAGNGYLPQK